MKKTPFIYKILAFVLVVAFTFQSLHSINSYTNTTGIQNLHRACPPLVCCNGTKGPVNHLSYNCGLPQDCNQYLIN